MTAQEKLLGKEARKHLRLAIWWSSVSPPSLGSFSYQDFLFDSAVEKSPAVERSFGVENPTLPVISTSNSRKAFKRRADERDSSKRNLTAEL